MHYVLQTYLFWLCWLCMVYNLSFRRTFSGSLCYVSFMTCLSDLPFLALLTQTDADDGQSGVAPEPVPWVNSFSRKHDIGALMVLKRHEKTKWSPMLFRFKVFTFHFSLLTLHCFIFTQSHLFRNAICIKLERQTFVFLFPNTAFSPLSVCSFNVVFYLIDIWAWLSRNGTVWYIFHAARPGWGTLLFSPLTLLTPAEQIFRLTCTL